MRLTPGSRICGKPAGWIRLPDTPTPKSSTTASRKMLPLCRPTTFFGRNGVTIWQCTTIIWLAMPMRNRCTGRQSKSGVRRRKPRSGMTWRCVSGNLAALDRAQGRFPAAEPLYREALQILDHGSNFAELRRSEGDLAGTESIAREAAALSERVFSPHEENAVTAAHALAVILRAEKRYDEADRVWVRTIRRSPWRWATWPTFAASNSATREAEDLSRQSLQIRRKVFGPEHPEVAINLNNLGYILRRRGDFWAIWGRSKSNGGGFPRPKACSRAPRRSWKKTSGLQTFAR
jgi:tetratricopeptide (TPR) repeat protein